MSVLKTRVITAIIFGAIMLTGLFWNEISFFILFFIISMGCLWEFLGLTLEEGKLRKVIGIIYGFVVCIIPIYFNFLYNGVGSWNLNRTIGWGIDFSNIWLYLKTLGFIVFFMPLVLLMIELFLKSEKPFNNIGLILIGTLYTVLPLYLFFYLGNPLINAALNFENFDFKKINTFTPNIVAGILFLNWANDSGAYLIGSRIGKTPLFPRISPKKTWEGTIGGTIFCLIIGYVLSLFFKELNTFDWVVLGGIVAVFGTLGDLIESMLKRSVGVKDSGSFMPGHGGFLDRFDAFIFSIPFAYLYLILKF